MNNKHRAPRPPPPLIYNLFPPLAGEVDHWLPHAERAAAMGFNWIFLNPIHVTGASGSLYAIKDYEKFNLAFFPYGHPKAQQARFARFAADCRAIGLKVIVDLVINHTAYDNPLTRDHREWYKLRCDGTIRSPGAIDASAPGGYVTWGDLSEIDNADSPRRDELWEFWWRLVERYLDAGVGGFRCDAAYKVPEDLWRLLIGRARERCPGIVFFAETLGCQLEDTLRLGTIHDYVFHSGKWWNYRDSWFLEQANLLAAAGSRSVGFPESHDTRRLAAEWGGDRDRAVQHYALNALAASGVMIPVGFEYGFRRKPHVVHTRPHDYEGAHYDLTDAIRSINRLKRIHPMLGAEGRLDAIDAGSDDALALLKSPPPSAGSASAQTAQATHANGADRAEGSDEANETNGSPSAEADGPVLMIFNRSDQNLELDLDPLLARAGAPASSGATWGVSAAASATAANSANPTIPIPADSAASEAASGARGERPRRLRLSRYGLAVFRLPRPGEPT